MSLHERRDAALALCKTIARATGDQPVAIMVPTLCYYFLAMHDQMDRKHSDLLVETLHGLIEEVQRAQLIKEAAAI